MQLGMVQKCTTEHSYSLPGPTIECSSQDSAQKQVWFNLADDRGKALQLPTGLASFLEQLEDATNEWSNAQHVPAPSSKSP